MFKYQDLLYLKDVHLPYQSLLLSWIHQVIALNNDGEISVVEGKVSTKLFEFAKVCEAVTQDMITRGSGNRDWQMKRLDIRTLK